jgi:membrane protein DedA with SNARE-associated domain
MNLAYWPGQMAYLAVFIAAIIEGEVVFVAASVLVGLGKLDPWGVFFAAALGGSAGDQFYFYALRGRLRGWLDRFPRLQAKQELVSAFVKRNSTGMILACRFLPGLRVAIPVACAHAGVSPFRFSSFSLISSAGWAALILKVVAHFGPASLAYLGVNVWWAPIVPAVLILTLFSFFRWLSQRPQPMLHTLGLDK